MNENVHQDRSGPAVGGGGGGGRRGGARWGDCYVHASAILSVRGALEARAGRSSVFRLSRGQKIGWTPVRVNRTPGPLSPYRFEACTQGHSGSVRQVQPRSWPLKVERGQVIRPTASVYTCRRDGVHRDLWVGRARDRRNAARRPSPIHRSRTVWAAPWLPRPPVTIEHTVDARAPREARCWQLRERSRGSGRRRRPRRRSRSADSPPPRGPPRVPRTPPARPRREVRLSPRPPRDRRSTPPSPPPLALVQDPSAPRGPSAHPASPRPSPPRRVAQPPTRRRSPPTSPPRRRLPADPPRRAALAAGSPRRSFARRTRASRRPTQYRTATPSAGTRP